MKGIIRFTLTFFTKCRYCKKCPNYDYYSHTCTSWRADREYCGTYQAFEEGRKSKSSKGKYEQYDTDKGKEYPRGIIQQAPGIGF